MAAMQHSDMPLSTFQALTGMSPPLRCPTLSQLTTRAMQAMQVMSRRALLEPKACSHSHLELPNTALRVVHPHIEVRPFPPTDDSGPRQVLAVLQGNAYYRMVSTVQMHPPSFRGGGVWG